MDLSSNNKEEEIVIVGGGICGLATALALHRKGIKSVVLEKDDSLQHAGTAITIYTNGWRALDQLNVGNKLRSMSIPLHLWREIWLEEGTTKEVSIGKEELRCVKRSDLIETMAEALPAGTIRFGCRIIGVQKDTLSTSHPILHLDNGSTINSKVVIGCDGVKSVIAKSLKLKAPKLSHVGALRCMTNYKDEHIFGNSAVLMVKNNCHLGIIPIDKKLVFWFLSWPRPYEDFEVSGHPQLLREAALDQIKDFPPEAIELVKNGDLGSIIYTRIKFRAPWELLLPSFREGTVTVAGDAMHVMGPFMGQGGSAAMEDAIVLARCLAQEMRNGNGGGLQLQTSVGMAFDKYVRERRRRILRLSMQTYFRQLLQSTLPLPVKLVIVAISFVLFGRSFNHAQYDCGQL